MAWKDGSIESLVIITGNLSVINSGEKIYILKLNKGNPATLGSLIINLPILPLLVTQFSPEIMGTIELLDNLPSNSLLNIKPGETITGKATWTIGPQTNNYVRNDLIALYSTDLSINDIFLLKL